MKQANILIDAREFIPGRMTGIGRMLAGLVDVLTESSRVKTIFLATQNEAIPAHLMERGCISPIMLPKSFIGAEWALSNLTSKGYGVFVSPYPKLPLFGVHCPCVHTIHDVLDLKYPLYRKRLKALLGKRRLKMALQRADLTWYDSQWSMHETEVLVGTTGTNPRVRYLGIDERFNTTIQEMDPKILVKYGLESQGYVLIIGNGLPHKNLGVLLGISERIDRKMIFIGVSKYNRSFWERLYPTNQAEWIEQVDDAELPALLRHAFCLFQPSLAEGYGYPPLEAMACGTPAIVSNIDVLVETTGGNTLVCQPYDGQSWIDAYQRIENVNIYQKQVHKGLEWVIKLKGRNGWAHHVADIKELLEGR